jgi:hypothetical protein
LPDALDHRGRARIFHAPDHLRPHLELLPHRWLRQVRIDDGSVLLALKDLDQELWAALACPTTGLEFDERTLRSIDTDGDDRIRAPELLAAIDWASTRLRSLDSLFSGAEAMPVSAIDESTPEGAAVAAGARQILSNLGRSGESSIGPADTGDVARLFVNTAFNGDGIIPADGRSSTTPTRRRSSRRAPCTRIPAAATSASASPTPPSTRRWRP